MHILIMELFCLLFMKMILLVLRILIYSLRHSLEGVRHGLLFLQYGMVLFFAISALLVWLKQHNRITAQMKPCSSMRQMIVLPILNTVVGPGALGAQLPVHLVPMVSFVIWSSRPHQYATRQHSSQSEITVKSKHRYGMVLRAHGEVFSSSIRSIIRQEVEIHNRSIGDLILSMRIVLVILSL